MIKLVIFDWDGTLFDSIDVICDCMLNASEAAGVAKREPEDIKEIIGLGLVEAIAKVWPHETREKQDLVIENYKHLFMKGDYEAPLAYPGVMDVLNHLQSSKVMMAVATGKSRRGLNRMMLETDTGAYFQATRCADETKSKPDPLMLQELLDELGVAAKEAVMVGDTEYDLMMAKAIGMASIGVSYGAHDKLRLLECDPIVVLDDFSKLIAVIEGEL
ncbi:HAD-IA family hydrolase [Marinomonas sp. 15G1-11]|uniref:HAD-IA family hydrolase n=1 Tax=Marinomonas phaeophyticola TaxID=3004091 RepID=A0ABT4JPD8_9GAMM|nr:HAD-IA family hydrolase [Marinomonas sp. 15G1-11]MCZ2720231.1 HAD-IA family hydrolase [Marinomonas sp. 15G1-11]